MQFNDLTYSLVNGQTYENQEVTFIINCPEGYDCTADNVTITLPPGTVKFTPSDFDPNPPPSGSGNPHHPAAGKYLFECGEDTLTVVTDGTGFTQSQIDSIIAFLAECQANQDGNAVLKPNPVVTPAGDPGIRLWNTEQTCTIECPEGETGDPVTVTVPANTNSTIIIATSTPLERYLAQQQLNQDAYNQACEQAEAELVCEPAIVCPVKEGEFAVSSFLRFACYVNGTDKLWVSYYNSFEVRNAVTAALENTVVGNVAQMVYCQAAGRVFGQDIFLSQIRAYNETTHAFIGSYAGNLKHTLDPTNNYIYSLNSAGELEIRNASTLAVISTTANLSAEIWSDPSYCPVNDRAYVPVHGVGIRMYNPHTGAFIGTIAYPADVIFRGSVWSPEASRVVVAMETTTDPATRLNFINPADDTITDVLYTTSGAASVDDLGRSESTGALYYNYGSGFDTIDPVGKTLICTNELQVAEGPLLCIDPTRDHLWVPNTLDDSLWLYAERP